MLVTRTKKVVYRVSNGREVFDLTLHFRLITPSDEIKFQDKGWVATGDALSFKGMICALEWLLTPDSLASVQNLKVYRPRWGIMMRYRINAREKLGYLFPDGLWSALELYWALYGEDEKIIKARIKKIQDAAAMDQEIAIKKKLGESQILGV